MSSKRCEVCNLNFIDEYSFHGHLMGKKHLKHVEIEKERMQKQQNSIFVSPIPHWATPGDVLKFFTQFGPIHYYRFGPNTVVIEFKSQEPADLLLSKPIYMDNWQLKIRRRIISPFYRKGNSSTASEEARLLEEKEEEIDTVVIELEEEETFDNQLKRLLGLIQPDNNEVQVRCDKVCLSLDRVLKTVFPKCRAIRFGSTITGLHLKGSDMDVFLDIGEPIRDDDDKTKYRRDVWMPKLVFKEVKNVLFKNRNIFTKVIPIPSAKIPVIKFNHLPTNTDCDISFKHSLGVHNSLLIKHLLSLDDRIKPLMIIIKYWAKRLDISGTGKITNYSLVILIIFYLQQPNLQILPTVKDIQSSCNPVFLSGWKINFNTEIKSIAPSDSSIPLLMYGFFKFYAEFAFNCVIISLLDGLLHVRSEYPKIAEKLGINCENLDLHRPACMQDPIKLDHNIISGWSERLLRDFQTCCHEAVKVCENAAKDKYNSLLSSLYSPAMKKQSKRPKKFQILIPALHVTKISIPISNNFNTADPQQSTEDAWFPIIYNIIEQIFEKIFKLEIQVVYNISNMKQMKIEEQSDVHTTKNDRIMLLCTGKYCLNRDRRNFTTQGNVGLNYLEREILISDKVLKRLQDTKDETFLKFTCVIEKRNNPPHAALTLTDAQYTTKSFNEVAVFMRSKIPLIVDKHLTYLAETQNS